MTAAHASQIIDGYLRRLDAEMSNLPPGRRKELHGQIAEHIDQARSELAEEPDGTVIISITSSASALTAPFFTQSGGFGWRITPDGRIDGL
jgi:hypothetical protein